MSNKTFVPSLKLEKMRITLVGDSPLISHQFSEKAKKEMLAKQQMKARVGREPKDPEQEFLGSLYEIPDTKGVYGFPAMAFKKAAVRGAKHISDIAMTDARGFFHILCEDHMLVPLRYRELKNVEDTVRIGGRGGGTTDLRYRGYFYGWEVDLDIQYNAAVVSPEQIVLMFDTAGFSTGVGDWRPEKDGPHGRFHVKKEDE